MEYIASRLVELRRKDGLTQQEMASKLGVSHRAFQSYERSEREAPLVLLSCLRENFGVDLNELLTGKPSAELDLESLRIVIESIEATLDSMHRVMAPGKKARLVVLCCELLASGTTVSMIQAIVRESLSEQ